MEFRNSRGTTVDPIPFFVVAASVFVVVYTFGPIYLMELNVPLAWALAVCTIVCGALISVAYYRFVWTTRPDYRGIVPVERRFKRLFYTILAGITLLGLFALPFLV
jgi:hypothetical protein